MIVFQLQILFELQPKPPTAGDRFERIHQIRQEMNELPDFGILEAFGVTLSKDPLNVEGIRRERPEIAFGCEKIIKPREDTVRSQ